MDQKIGKKRISELAGAWHMSDRETEEFEKYLRSRWKTWKMPDQATRERILNETFGSWKEMKETGVEYARRMRKEWDEREQRQRKK